MSTKDSVPEAQVAALTGKLKNKRNARAAADEMIVKLETQIDALRSDLAEAVEQAERKESDLVALKERHWRIERDHAALGTTLKSVQDELREVTRKYRSTQATLARTRAGLDNARAREARSEIAAAELADELRKLRSKWHIRAMAALWASIVRVFAPLRNRKANPRQAANLVIASGLFDRSWYEERYPDVKQTGSDPLEHFMCHGWQENRDPGPDFSVSRYLRENPDVAEAGCNPLLHYIEFGQSEGRGAQKSKLAGRAATPLPTFAPPAPVYRPDEAERIAPAAPAPLATPDTPATFNELREARHSDIGTSAAFEGFEALCAGLKNGRRQVAWPEGRCGMPGVLMDCWFISERDVRLRFDQAITKPAAAFQVIGGSPQAIRITAPLGGEIVDLHLLSPLQPLLFVSQNADNSVVATLLVFPSLLRGGLHHLEYLAHLASAEDASLIDPFTFSSDLAASLASSRAEDNTPAISSLSIDLQDATGTGCFFDPVFRAWLRETFDVPISAVSGDHDAGAAHLARIVGQDGTGGNGATLELPADMVPSLGLLCAALDDELGRPKDVPLGLAHLYGVNDDSQPSLAVMIPAVPLDLPSSAAVTHFKGQARLRGSAGFRRHPGIAGIKRVRTAALSNGELLFPVSAALPLTGFKPGAIRLVLDCGGDIEENALRTLNSLAMQSCAAMIEIAVLNAASLAVRNHADALFQERTFEAESWESAIAWCEATFCGSVLSGTVFHDWRTLAMLCDFVSSGAASASCPLVTSVRVGKSWSTHIVDNGLVAERPGDPYADALVQSSGSLWGCTYPVRAPVAGLWITLTEKLARWVHSETHRLDRADGDHWCTAMTSTTFIGDIAGRSAGFEPPLADPSRFTSVRICKG